MTSRFKIPLVRDPKWIKHVHGLPCVLTAHVYVPEWSTTAVDPAHIRDGLGGGMGFKPSDDLVLPLRHDLHIEQHTDGERPFWRKHIFDREEFVMELLATYAYNTDQFLTGNAQALWIAMRRVELSKDDDFMMALLKGRARELYRRFKNKTLDAPF
jgi:hypothetical protein